MKLHRNYQLKKAFSRWAFRLSAVILVVITCSWDINQAFNFTSYDSKAGFVQKEIMQILQDKYGRMWFATWDGLYQFDGYNFKNYKAHPGDGVQLESNRLENICEEGNHIWMRGYNGSVSIFDMTTQKIASLPLQNYIARKMYPIRRGGIWILMANNSIVKAWADAQGDIKTKTYWGPSKPIINHLRTNQDGNLWILTHQGIYRYVDSKHTIALVKGPFDCYNMLETANRRLFCCSAGRLLVQQARKFLVIQLPTASWLTDVKSLPNGKFFVSTGNNGAFLLNRQYKVEKHYTMANSALTSNTIMGLKQDSKGNVWFCCKAPGVMRFDARKEVLQRLFIAGEFSQDPVQWRNQVRIVEDQSGHLWVTPSGNGLALYDSQKNELLPFFDSEKLPYWTTENTVVDMFVDQQGNLWYNGKYTGLQKATPRRQHVSLLTLPTQTESDKDVRSVFQDHQGRIWIGAKSGVVSVLDSKMNLLGTLSSDGSIRQGHPTAIGHAYCFVEEKNGTIWMGTKYNGLFRLKPKGPRQFDVKHYIADGKPWSLSHNDIFSLCIDRRNRLWIGTYGGGLCYLDLNDPQTRIQRINNQKPSWNREGFSKVRCVVSDKKGNIWVGTTSGLIVFRDDFRRPFDIRPTIYKRDPYKELSLSANDVLQVFFAHDGTPYVCTYGGGFCRIVQKDPQNIVFEPFTIFNGLKSDVVLSCQEDKMGAIWFATENGLVKYIPRSNRVETFSKQFLGSGIDFNEGQSVRLMDGRILIPSRNAIAVCFNPVEMKGSLYKPQIVFSRFFLEQKECIPLLNPDILPHDINYTDEVVLPHGMNSFSIEFAALDFNDPDNINYSYKLEGIDKTWNIVGDGHIANYSALPPGKYTFLVKSTNSDGIWVDNVRSLKIEIKPSFWQTGWAMALYCLIIVAIIALSTYILFTILRLKQKVEVERQISELKLRFFTNVSHEIRTPLTLISGSVKEMLRRGVDDGLLKKSLLVVDANANRLLRLVNQILDLRKIGSGKMGLRLQKTDVGNFLKELMDSFTDLARQQNIHLVLNVPQTPVEAWIDREKIDKVVFNLLSNAFRFTREGKSITVSLIDGRTKLNLQVKDEGKGISPEKQKTIFEMFSSDDEGSVLQMGHTGVGLALTKELVEMHHGSISVKSKEGSGSIFTVILPKEPQAKGSILQEKISDDEPTSPQSSASDMQSPTGESLLVNFRDNEVDGSASVSNEKNDKPLVLIVEDNQEMRDFLNLILKEQYLTKEASNGKQGLEAAKQLQPDLIVTDYMMPELDGMEMAHQLKADVQTSHIPIIILSARTDDDSKIKGFETGIDAYIDKPFNADVLRARIENLLAKRAQLQEANLNRYVNKKDDYSENLDNEADRQFLEKLTSLLEEHIADSELGVDQVAQMLGMSHSVYFKKLKALTGLGPNNYLKQLRMQRASELIDTGKYTLVEVATMVGIGDVHYFSKCFKQHTGLTPTEWKRRSR